MDRKRFALALGVAGLVLMGGSALWAKEKAGKNDGIAWVRDYQAAAKQAKDEGKWMFVDFYTDS